ncbi:MAG: hypothetical protein AAF327_15875 [Cyanobacteria bacterium P01_A01_bin.37]
MANFVQGNLTRVLFGILAEETLALDTPTAPPNSVITVDNASNIAAGSTSIDCDALAAPVPAGSVIYFGAEIAVTTAAAAAIGDKTITISSLGTALASGSKIHFAGDVVATLRKPAASGATTLYVKQLTGAIANTAAGKAVSALGGVKTYTTASAPTGATSIQVKTTTAEITDDHTGIHEGLILLQGGKSADFSIDNGTTEETVFGDEVSYSNALVTSASWNISYSANVLPTDDGYYRLTYAAQQALAGVYGWVKAIDPTPAGASSGESEEGLCTVSGFSKTRPSDGIISMSSTFNGAGTPDLENAA